MAMVNFAGIEIGGTKIQVVVGDEKANIIDRLRFDVNKERGADGIRADIVSAFARLDKQTIRSIGIGFGGPIDHVTGKIFTSYHIDGWTNFPITQWLQQETGILVSVDNDANVASLGEALFGAGRNYEKVLYITLGSGLGSGLVIDKKIYHGARPGEMELGHIRLKKDGTTLESSCAGWGVDRKIRDRVSEYPGGVLAKLVAKVKTGQAKFLLQAMQENDSLALEIFEETIDDLAFGVSHAVHLLHPETVVLGGGMSQMGEVLRSALEKKLPQYLMDAFQPGPDIQLAKLSEDAVPVGALALAIQNQR